MSNATTLADAASQIEQKAKNKEDAENVDAKAKSAQRSLERLNKELEELAEAVSKLQFYRRLLREAFSHSDNLPSVTSALEQAEAATERDRNEVTHKLVDLDTARLQQEISDATDEVEEATETVKDELREYWSDWDDRLSSARELQRIIGQQEDKFAQTVNWLERLVHQGMQNPAKNASSIVNEWENASKQWKNNESLQGLSAFKQTHGLDDETVDVIRQLSQDSVHLSDVDMDVLQELKQVTDLADAVELKI
ncbi:hypothetical protein [Natronorubrum sp. A-ect3]|uniref:hypothetical protein n=1 Tax=Natronorubrum sp. A-ect3 TaxID=3242698 RepID=UPI00359E9CE5